MSKNLLICFIVSCFFACKTTKNVNSEAAVFRTDPHILFAGFQFQDDQLIVTNQLVTAGKLKTRKTPEQKLKPKDILLVQLDSNGKVLSKEAIKNPRIRTFEYANDDGSFVKKQEEVADVQFNFRVQLENKTEHVEVREISTENFRTLLSIDIVKE